METHRYTQLLTSDISTLAIHNEGVIGVIGL